jgi:hypothetical protein
VETAPVVERTATPQKGAQPDYLSKYMNERLEKEMQHIAPVFDKAMREIESAEARLEKVVQQRLDEINLTDK